ncbi:MAG: serine hydrolase domain-containing protein [Bacteroidota bacterium]
MKKNLLLFFVLLIFTACSDDNPTANDLTPKFNRIQALMDSSWNGFRATYNLPSQGGIALFINYKGTTKFLKVGMDADVNENYHFRIASNTKVFTSAAVMLLHQRGLLNIDDKITALMPNKTEPYIPETPAYNVPFKDRITIRQLMQHMAGVYDITNYNIPDTVKQLYKGKNYLEYICETLGEDHQFTFEELVGVVSENHIYSDEPGTKHKYSNTGYTILAKIIERVSGMSYREFITTELIQKNNLNNTSCPTLASEKALPSPYIRSYLFAKDQAEDVSESNMSGNVAEGNIVSTPAEMSKWIKLFLTGNAGVNQQNIEIMKDYSINPVYKYGLGIFYSDTLGYGHNGAHEAYLSYVMYNEEMDCSICFVCTLWDYSGGTASFIKQFNYVADLCKKAVGIMK